MGDLNINLLKHSTHKDTGDFLNILFSNFYFPLITRPTRIVDNSATLIDNIFCSNVSNNTMATNGLLYTDVSDHLPIFSIISKHVIELNDKPILQRSITAAGTVKFKAALSATNWNEITRETDAQVAYTVFDSTIRNAYEDAYPVKRLNTQKAKMKPWLTSSLKHCINVKNRLYMKYRKFPCVYNEKLETHGSQIAQLIVSSQSIKIIRDMNRT